MNSRERLLAIAVGSLLVAVGGYALWSLVSGWYAQPRTQIAQLQKKILDRKRQLGAARVAADRLASYRRRSLPAQPELARSLYLQWLLARVSEAGLADQNVTAVASRASGKLYSTHTFNVTGRGTLEQATRFLHAVEQTDYLHRVSRLSVKPLKDSKLLDLSLTVEALSLATAEAKDRLPELPPRPLPPIEECLADILQRNLFAPPNQPPQLAAPSSLRGATLREVEIALKASDPDPLDRLSFRLAQASAADARLDASSGRLRFTPRKPGEYEFEVLVSDDGIPVATASRKFSVQVTDPPPPDSPRPPEPKPLGFDQAKFTVLSGIVEVNGSPEVWLHIRPTGQTLKLREGDAFEVGSVKGVIASIDSGSFTYESAGKRRSVGKGEMLAQGRAAE